MLITENIGETFYPNFLETPKEMTKRYLTCLETMGYFPKRSNVLYKRDKYPMSLPSTMTSDEKKEFVRETFKKWKNGVGNGADVMNGFMWAYNNIHKIHVRAGGGETFPTYRRYDHETFNIYHRGIHGDLQGKGLVAVGKRGEGKSAKIGSLALSVISTLKSTNVILTSKDDKTGQDLLRDKVKFTYYRLPEYLKHNTALDNRNELYLGDGKGLGVDSRIVVRAPEPQALEGQGARLWVHDEAGKTKDLVSLLENSLPLLNGEDGFTRVGFPILIGVAGEFDKFGTDYIRIWENYQTYNFVRWFIPGWAGMNTDKFGNEDIEQAVEKIFTERISKFKMSETSGADEVQRFPLTPEECFLSATDGVLPKKKITTQIKIISQNPIDIKTGDLQWISVGESVLFMPSATGKVKILEHPISGAKKNQYVSFIDAYDIQEKRATSSKGAIVIFKRKMKMAKYDEEHLISKLSEADNFEERMKIRIELGYLPVAIYIDDCDDPRDFGEKAMRLSVYYKAMCLCEKFPSQIFVYLKDRYNQWLQYKSVKPDVKKLKKEHFIEKGVKIDDHWKSYRTSFLQSYFEDNCESIYFKELLMDGMEYDPEVPKKKKDSIDALGGCLIHDKQPFLKDDANIYENENKSPTIYGYIRKSDGGVSSKK